MTANLRKKVVSLVVFSLLGGLTTIVVAWLSNFSTPNVGLGLKNTRAGGSPLSFDDLGEKTGYTGWLVMEFHGRAVVRYTSSWYDAGMGWGLAGGWPSDPPEPLVPDWAPFIAPTHHTPQKTTHSCIAEARGWPFLALSGGLMVSHVMAAPGKLEIYSALVLDPAQTVQPNGWQQANLLPYKPLLLGFAGDTLVYGAIWFVVWILARTAWQVVTLRRRFQFSLRTLLLVVTFASALMGWVGYSLNWIRQRHAVLEDERFAIVDHFDDPRAAPSLLWLFGEDGMTYLICDKCNREDRLVLQRLFPESEIRDHSDDENELPAKGSGGLF